MNDVQKCINHSLKQLCRYVKSIYGDISIGMLDPMFTDGLSDQDMKSINNYEDFVKEIWEKIMEHAGWDYDIRD